MIVLLALRSNRHLLEQEAHGITSEQSLTEPDNPGRTLEDALQLGHIGRGEERRRHEQGRTAIAAQGHPVLSSERHQGFDRPDEGVVPRG